VTAEPSSIHLEPSQPIAPDVLLPGDPGRAMALAQQLLAKPLMSNHSRGLWGYSGETREGMPLTIQSTGMGGPSAAIVLHELAELGVRRAIRVGTCAALEGSLELGELVVAEAALPGDGVSRALGQQGPVEPDPALHSSLERAAACRPVLIASTDLFHEYDEAPREGWIRAGAAVVEMECAPLFTLGRRLGVALACALIVSDVFAGAERVRIEPEALGRSVQRMGAAAAAALAF